MRIFRDNKGRSWEVVLNVHQIKRVRAALGVDLVNVITLDKDGAVKVDLIDRIANDPCLLVDILYIISEAQAQKIGVNDVEFGESLAGDAIEEATKAFLDELVDFFPAARRLFLKKAVDIARKFAGEWTSALEKALNDPAFDERIAQSISSSASSPESSV